MPAIYYNVVIVVKYYKHIIITKMIIYAVLYYLQLFKERFAIPSVASSYILQISVHISVQFLMVYIILLTQNTCIFSPIFVQMPPYARYLRLGLPTSSLDNYSLSVLPHFSSDLNNTKVTPLSLFLSLILYIILICNPAATYHKTT